jgi:hypothetical protein
MNKRPRTGFSLNQSLVWNKALLFWVAILAISPQLLSAGSVASMLQGTVESAGHGLAGYRVTLNASLSGRHRRWIQLGSGFTDRSGQFKITYSLSEAIAKERRPVLFVEADKGVVVLASAIGVTGELPGHVVVNERTTVAVGNAFAQFVRGKQIEGNTYGMVNAASMAANFADPVTGGVGVVLFSSPNGEETSTLATFNSLSNVVAACVAEKPNCRRLFAATHAIDESEQENTLQAIANLVKSPSYPDFPFNAKDPVFGLSQRNPFYQPALERRPTSWLLFLKITGGSYSEQGADNLLNGPGNFAIDREGYVWVNTNYVPQPLHHFACAGLRLVEFDPSGQPVAGTPFTGGGLLGAGYGITLDPQGNVWVGNFGFQDPPCQFLPQAATNNSVSQFQADGSPISPSQGYTQGNISWPQGTVSDRSGNIWIGNCGNDSVTKFPGGDPNRAINIALSDPPPPAGEPQMKPFGLATDRDENVWVTNPGNSTVSIISPRGKLLKTLASSYKGRTMLTHPVGNASDTHGNIWVANSDMVSTPCPSIIGQGPGTNPSITLYDMETRKPYPGSPFTGGGLTLPWGIAVDGNDTVWVFNFGAKPPLTPTLVATGISHFCGADPSKCPAGTRTGDPISPRTGYRSDAFERITGGQIDPSGNIWMTSNWKIRVNPFMNPGGNSIVVAVGAAAPINTPLIGPPVPFY